jgi:hypothetical protein
MNSNNHKLTSLTYKNKYVAKKSSTPLIISKILSNQTGDNSPSNLSGNEYDWQTVPTESNKRIRSPNNATSLHSKKDINIFISPNRFSPITPVDDDSQMVINANDHTQRANETKSPIPPPIFIAQELNFNNFTIKINELTNSTGFKCKATTKSLKLQTLNSDSYRAVVKYLKKNTRYHTIFSRTKKIDHIE